MENEKKFMETKKALLIDFLITHKNIETYGTTNKAKAALCNDILQMNNSQQVSGISTVRQIKSVYDVSKRNARKDKSDSCVELYKTDGGRNFLTLSSSTDKVISILSDHLELLQNIFDCDFDYPNSNTTMVTDNEEEYIMDTINDEDLSDDDMIDDELTKKRSLEILTSKMHENKKIKSFQFIQPVTENANIDKNVLKPSTSKKVFEGLQHLMVAEEKEKVRDDLNSLAYKRSKLKLEIAKKKRNIIALREKTEKEKCESELRQIKLREQILESELRQNKIKEQILSKQTINL